MRDIGVLRWRGQTLSAFHMARNSCSSVWMTKFLPVLCVGILKSTTTTGLDPLMRPQYLKVELQTLLNPLQEKMKILDKFEADWYQSEKHIKDQAQHIENQIKEQFKKLRDFLQEEEDLRLSAMRTERAQRSRELKDQIESLGKRKATLSATITAAKDQLKVNKDFSFLQKYKATVEAVERTVMLPDPQAVSGTLMDVAKHLGNLTFGVWNNMKKLVSYTPLILDPNTAGCRLNLSEDLTCVKVGLPHQLPDNPERCKYSEVKGSEGLNPGKNASWEVEVGDHKYWRLGVSVQSYRNRLEDGSWLIELHDGKYSAISSGKLTSIPVNQKARRIGVQLDWINRKLTFSDLDSNTHLHTFRHNFTERLFPTFGTYTMHLPLKVIPRKLCVTQEYSR